MLAFCLSQNLLRDITTGMADTGMADTGNIKYSGYYDR
jgi:hypothetical protein